MKTTLTERFVIDNNEYDAVVLNTIGGIKHQGFIGMSIRGGTPYCLFKSGIKPYGLDECYDVAIQTIGNYYFLKAELGDEEFNEKVIPVLKDCGMI